MLSYRHAFHAGNFADVLKHVVLLEILAYLAQKEKPFCVIDTHAGGGKYALDSDFALKTREFDTGISQLWKRDDLPSSVANYVEMQKRFNQNGQFKTYAGSPLLIKQMLRVKDRLCLFELHSNEFEILKTNMKLDKRIQLEKADGLKSSLGLLPPVERRGLMLIDPSYEMKSDYLDVVKTLIQMHKRFATGTYALWYPVIERGRNEALETAFKKSGILNIQLFELGINAHNSGRGMNASGMIIINPPWNLATTMQTVLPFLSNNLGENGAGNFRIETLVAEN
ncbi:MAG: 23S rRNA (adenine(2030)-N(6))-methyltransferase RlmJ [Methylococcaceae bacterium]